MKFAVTLRGYDRGQVEEYRRRAESRIADCERRASSAESRPTPTQLEAEDLLRRARCRAEQQADTITAAAEAAARKLLLEARLEARLRLDEAEAKRRRVEEEIVVLRERCREARADLERIREGDSS